MIKISCQEQLLPGQTLQEKFEFARSAGYDGIELRARGDFAFRDRLPELRRAARDGVPMPSVCVDMSHFFAAFDPDLRRDALAQLKSQLTVIAEVGGPGAVVCTPASWGMFSRRLPPFEPPRSELEDRAVLLEGLAELGEHAARGGATRALGPQNRDAVHMVNRREPAVEVMDPVGRPSPDGGTRPGSTRPSSGSPWTAGSTRPGWSPTSFRWKRRRPRTACSTSGPTRLSRWC